MTEPRAEKIPRTMRAMVTMGHGGLDQIVYHQDWPHLIDCLDRGGRYVCSGAITGPMVELDLRTLYLRDLSFFGSTIIGPEIMSNLVGYIESGAIRPLLAATYPLTELREAQAAFIAKQHSGNIVVQP